MQEFWIIGGGKFGRRAAETIGRAGPAADILIVEKDPRRCQTLIADGFPVIEADGIDFLKNRLISPLQKQWIVAAAPVHVAYEWVRACLAGNARLEPQALPAELAGLLPNAMHGGKGQWVASNADFICPADCPEAGSVCSFFFTSGADDSVRDFLPVEISGDGDFRDRSRSMVGAGRLRPLLATVLLGAERKTSSR